jgi:hypothetical protein
MLKESIVMLSAAKHLHYLVKDKQMQILRCARDDRGGGVKNKQMQILRCAQNDMTLRMTGLAGFSARCQVSGPANTIAPSTGG